MVKNGIKLEGECLEYYEFNEKKVWSILPVFPVLLN